MKNLKCGEQALSVSEATIINMPAVRRKTGLLQVFLPVNRLSLFILCGFSSVKELLKKLGKFKTGKSCLYINKLSDINIDILKTIISESFQTMKKKYSEN
jgi:hypothetical protein